MYRPLAFLLAASFAFAGCGGGDPAADVEQAPTTQPSTTPSTPKPKPQPKPEATVESLEDCGDVPASADGGDQATNVQADGVDCTEALDVAAKVMETMATPTDGWACPTISEYAQAAQKCTNGAKSVEWTVKFL